jgi:gliding motility-associated-like protein
MIRPAYVKIIRPVISIPSLPVRGCIPYSFSPVANINTRDVVTSYLWNFGDGFTSSSPTPSHTYTTQGVYTVSLVITTSTGCTDSLVLSSSVRVGRRPVINFSAAPNPVCAFVPVQFTNLTNESDEWSWSFGDGSYSSIENPSHQYADTGLFNVVLIAGNNGCLDSLRMNNYIRVKPPVAKFGFVTSCLDRLQFNFVDSSIGATTWFWNFGDGTTSTQQNPVHFFPGLNTYNVSLTVTNDTCSHTLTKPVRVIDETPDFFATFTSACRRTTFFFTATVSNPANITEFLWFFGDGTQWSSNVFNSGGSSYHYYPDAGNYTVTLITTDIYGCKDTVVKTNYIRVNGPTANFSASNTSGCKGLVTTFNDLSLTDGISAITGWRWDFGDGVVRSYTSGPFQHTYATPGTFSVKLVVTDAKGCMDSLLVSNLVVATDPKAGFFSADSIYCPNKPVRFTNTSTGINLTSFWTLGDGNIDSIPEPVHAYADTGYYTIKLVVTDQYGCSDSLTKPKYITIKKPVASFTVSDSISSCTPFEVKFTNTSYFWGSLNWNLGGGTSSLENPVQYYFLPGNYPISLAVVSAGGCTDTAYKTISVYDTIGTRVTYLPLDGCKPLDVGLDAFSPGPMTFTWDFGDGVLITNKDTTLRHIYNFFGDFVPKVIMTDPAGCIIPVTGNDTIRIKGATAKFGVDRKLFCDSGLVNFIDSTTYNDSVTRYHWDFGDGNISSQRVPPPHYYTSPGLYTVMLNVQTQNTCVDTFRLQYIRVVESPLVSIGGDSVICIYDTLQHFGVFGRLDTSVVRWNWQFPNGNSSGLQDPPGQQYRSAGNFVVQTIATNSSGCADTAMKNIRVNPLPVITVPSSMTMQAGFPITIPADYSPNVASYTWFPGATLSCTNCPQPVASPKFNTTYNVAVVDSNGCKNNAQVQVIVICKNANVFVPNTFSPNGDGSNDVFYVRGKGLDRVKSLRIFNRWGEVVFEQSNFPVNDPNYGWKGTYKNHKPVPDVYVYQVEVFCENSQIIRFEGNVALIQ